LHSLHPKGYLLNMNKQIRYSKNVLIIILLNNTSWTQLDETFSKFSFQNIMFNTPIQNALWTYWFHWFIQNLNKICYFMGLCFLHIDVVHLNHLWCMYKYFQSFQPFQIFENISSYLYVYHLCFKHMTSECKKHELITKQFLHEFHY